MAPHCCQARRPAPGRPPDHNGDKRGEPGATTTWSVIVGQAPAFDSADSVGHGGIPVQLDGDHRWLPGAVHRGHWVPAGWSFTDNGNGTATISGTPTAAEVGANTIDLSAVSVAGTASRAWSSPWPRPR